MRDDDSGANTSSHFHSQISIHPRWQNWLMQEHQSCLLTTLLSYTITRQQDTFGYKMKGVVLSKFQAHSMHVDCTRIEDEMNELLMKLMKLMKWWWGWWSSMFSCNAGKRGEIACKNIKVVKLIIRHCATSVHYRPPHLERSMEGLSSAFDARWVYANRIWIEWDVDEVVEMVISMISWGFDVVREKGAHPNIDRNLLAERQSCKS